MNTELGATPVFGPQYCKINTAFQRDKKGFVIPERWATPEIAYLADAKWQWTEKVDGMNIRLHWNGKRVNVGGREDNSLIPARLLANLNLDSELWGDVLEAGATIYGEGYGEGIRSGGQYQKSQQFIAFDVNVAGWWLSRENIEDVCDKLGISVVPVWGHASVSVIWEAIKEGSLSSEWPQARIEGLVGKPAVELHDRKGERILVKLKLRDWHDYLPEQEREGKKSGDSTS